jgi:hypothetical protein
MIPRKIQHSGKKKPALVRPVSDMIAMLRIEYSMHSQCNIKWLVLEIHKAIRMRYAVFCV